MFNFITTLIGILIGLGFVGWYIFALITAATS